MATKKSSSRKKSNQRYYDEGGFDAKSVLSLLVIIIGVALVIVLVRAAGGDDGTDNPAPVQSDVSVSTTVSTTTTTVAEPGETSESTTTTTKSFTVTVGDIERTYQLTEVKTAQAASLKITNLTNVGFDFVLKMPNDTVSGTAVFTASTKAEYDGSIFFDFGDKYVLLSGSGSNGGGKYITGEPVYTDAVPAVTYDASLKTASSVRSTMSSLMSDYDYSLAVDILDRGSDTISPASSEYTLDKNGKGVLVDKEMGIVKFQSFNDDGECILLCGENGLVYIAVYDYFEVRYYTNDSARASSAPNCIKNYATARGVELVYCN